MIEASQEILQPSAGGKGQLRICPCPVSSTLVRGVPSLVNSHCPRASISDVQLCIVLVRDQIRSPADQVMPVVRTPSRECTTAKQALRLRYEHRQLELYRIRAKRDRLTLPP